MKVEAYLIEARSLGGLSGSPAFVHLGIVRIKKESGLVWANDSSGVCHWMGLVQAHFEMPLSHLDVTEEEGDSAVHRARVNAGIAVVVPATRIVEIFGERTIRRQQEDYVRAKKLEKAEESGVVLDSANE